MTTRGEINSNFYQIVNVDANGAPTSVKSEYLPNTANANYANFAGTAFSVSGSNVTGIVGNATHANVADLANSVAGANVTGIVANASHATVSNSANSVAVANVVGIGNIATLNLTGSSSNVLYGNGVFAPAGSAGIPNYANFAGTAFSVDGANVVGPVSFATTANSVAGSNVIGYVANATHATVSDSANSVAGSNVSGYVLNASHATVADTANSIMGANVTGIVANATYAATAGVADSVAGANVTGVVANATYATTSGSADSVAGSNVTGQVANALVAGTVYSNNQPNINSVGPLANLTVIGVANLSTTNVTGNVNATGNISAAYFLGNVIGNISGNIVVPGTNTSVLYNDTGSAGASSNFTFDEATNIVTVIGNVVANYFIGDGSLITNINGNSIGNVGNAIHANVADVANSVAGANVSGAVAFATTANSVAGANVSGEVSFAAVANSVAGANVSGDVSGSNHANISDAANVAYGVSGANVVGSVANATYSNIAGVAYSVNGSNVSGDVAGSDHANVADVANSVAVSNVVGIGNIATVNLDGNVSNILTGLGTFVAIPSVSANANYANFAGQVVDATQSNITSLGTLVDLNVEGNIFSNTAVYVGNTSNATGLTNPTIVAKKSGATFVQIALVNGSANGSADLVAYGDNGSDSGAFVDVGFTSSSFDDPLYTITKSNDGYMFVQGDDSSANGGNLVIATGAQGSTKDIIFATGGFLEADEKMRYSHALGQLYIQPNTAATDTTTGALRVGGGVGIAGDVYAGNVVSANFFLGDGGLLSNITISGNVAYANYANYAGEAFSVAGSNVVGQVANSLVAGTVYTNAQPNITSTGTLTGLNVNGVVTANTFTSNVATGTAPFTVSSNTVVANLYAANAVAASQSVYSGGGIPATTMYIPLVQGSGYRTAYVDTSVTGIQWDDNDHTLIAPEFEGQLVASPGSTTKISPGATSIDTRISGTSRLLVNATGANVTGNVNATTSINAPRFVSNVATGTAPFTVTSTTQVANLNVATAGVADVANSVAGSNVSGQVANALVAGTVYTNTQPNITSVGTLSSLNVTGTTTTGGVTATGGSVLIENGGANSGTLSVDGAGNAVVFGTIVGNVIIGSVTSNAIMGNLVTANYFSGNGSLLTGVTATAGPGGSNTQVQYNNSGVLDGSPDFYYDNTTTILHVPAVEGILIGQADFAATAYGVNASSIANVIISGGTSGQVISTDGAGNLSFVDQSGGGGGTDFTPSFLLGGM